MPKMTTITTEDIETILQLHEKLNAIFNPEQKKSRDDRYIITKPRHAKPDQIEEAKKAINAIVAQKPLSPIVDKYFDQLFRQFQIMELDQDIFKQQQERQLKEDLKHYKYIPDDLRYRARQFKPAPKDTIQQQSKMVGVEQLEKPLLKK